MQDTAAVLMRDEVFSRLDNLAAEMGVAVEHLWGVFVRQAPVEAVTIVGLVAFAVFGWVLYAWLWKRIAKAIDGDIMDEPETGMPFIIAAVVLGILTLGAAISLLSLPTLLMNPEYWAFKEILELIGK